MRLLSIASSFPETNFSQLAVWQQIKSSEAFGKLTDRSKMLLEKILMGDSGIDSRAFAVDDLLRLFSSSPDQLNQWHEEYGTVLASNALEKALRKADLDVSELDALVVCTCTGYLCPGLASHIAEAVNAPDDLYLLDIAGLGCGAAIPTLRAGHGVLAAQPDAKVAVIAVEVCSAAFYMDNDPGVLISLCLFGDGCSASIWDGSQIGGYILDGFDTVHAPEDREKVRFINETGYLKNKLHKSVPELSASAVKTLWERQGNKSDQYDDIISHGGGKEVVNQLKRAFPDFSFFRAAEVLKNHGNMSSPSVMVALERALEESPQKKYWLTSFGAGFAAHSANLEMK